MAMLMMALIEDLSDCNHKAFVWRFRELHTVLYFRSEYLFGECISNLRARSGWISSPLRLAIKNDLQNHHTPSMPH